MINLKEQYTTNKYLFLTHSLLAFNFLPPFNVVSF